MTASVNLDSRTLVTRIADLLRDQIITGTLAPGKRIRQDEFAEAFGVSRTPLREAFRLLAAEGWIQIRPRSGVAVSQFSPDEVQDILTMRLLLEPLAIRVSALTHTDDDEKTLRKLNDRLQTARPSRQDRAGAYDAAVQEFHFALYGLKSDAAVDPVHVSLRSYWERYSRYRRVYYGRTVDSISRSNDEHVALIDAWARRDADQAEVLLAQHILHAGNALVCSLAGDSTPAFHPKLNELAGRYRCDLD